MKKLLESKILELILTVGLNKYIFGFTLLEYTAYTLIVIFHPKYWLTVQKYGRRHNNKVLYMINNNYNVQPNGTHCVTFFKEDHEFVLWKMNYPYAFGWLYPEDNSKNKRPSRKTIIKLKNYLIENDINVTEL